MNVFDDREVFATRTSRYPYAYVLAVMIALSVATHAVGCALLGGAADRAREGGDDTRIMVQYVTIKLVEESDEVTAEDVLAVVDAVEAAAAADPGRPFTVPQLESVVPFERLSASDELLARYVFRRLADEFARRLGGAHPDGTLRRSRAADADPVEELSVLLGWVREAAPLARE